MAKISVVLSKKTHDELQALGRKGETFDHIIAKLLETKGMEI